MNLSLEEQNIVYEFYMTQFLSPRRFRIGKAYRCPFPNSPEKKPSFTIFFTRDKDALLWKMFNSSESGNVYTFVARMETVPVRLGINVIRDILNNHIEPITNINIQKDPDPNINVRNHFTLRELKYWEREAGLSEEDLIELDIYPLSSLSYNSKKIAFASTNSEPKFIYPFYFSKNKKKIGAWQMYNPTTKNVEYKWRSGGDEIIGNHWNLPEKADSLYITSSKKDGAVLWKHILKKKYPFIHPPKEMQIDCIIKEASHLRQRFPNIKYIPDIEYLGLNKKGKECPGLINAKKLKYEAGIDYIKIAFPRGVKDLTELYKVNKLNLVKL